MLYDYANIGTFPQAPLDIVVDINTQYAASWYYYLSWSVTDENADLNGYNNSDKVLQCFVYDSKGLIGSYTGTGPNFNLCDFQTTDKKIDVFFRVRPLDKNQDPNLRYFELNTNCDFSEFRKVTLIVKNTISKKITLENNTGIKTLTHINKGALFPDNMPCSQCCDYDVVLNLSKPYLSVTTGKILKGYKWLNRKSVKTIVNNLQLIQIDPEATYQDLTGNKYTGLELIVMKQIDLKKFDIDQFEADKDIPPYPSIKW
ncbi:MAG: hypothetical protein IPI65_07395 [Bacteroidetes bacterium]|nr:hypothetical protein [Bacteroidota bacterium]